MSKILKSTVTIALLVTLSSCTEGTIDPIEDDGSVFSFYGYVTVGESPNYVRIKDLSKPLLSEKSEFDGSVTFEDIQTGEITALQDTIVNFDGNYTHNFRIPNEIEPDKEYLLKAERSDGEIVESIATTPKITEIEYTPDENIYCETEMNITFRNVEFPEMIDFEIFVFHGGQEYSADLNLFEDQLEYVGDNEVRIKLSPRNLLVEVFPPNIPDISNFDMYLLYPTISCSNLTTSEIVINYTHFGQEWYVAKPQNRGRINFESGDVKNGLGFFGAVLEDTFTITFDN